MGMTDHSPDKTKQVLTCLAFTYDSPTFKFFMGVPGSNTCLVLCGVRCGVVFLDVSATNIDPPFY
jgi:hypothetical protein